MIKWYNNITWEVVFPHILKGKVKKMKNFKRVAALILALVMMATVFAGCSKSYDKGVVLEETLAAEEYGIGFRNEDIALGMAVQNALEEMIADGTAAEISKQWLGADLVLNGEYKEDVTIAEDDDSLQKILDRGTLILGLDDSFPPMGFRDENNEIVGFDIDLAKEVAKRLGVELVLQPIDWNSKEMELNSGNIDCIWNGMTINEERLGTMFIPKAYIANEQIIIVGDGSGIETKADLEGKIVGLQAGSSALEALESDTATYESVKEVVEYADNVAAYLDLKAGRIDALVVDSIVGYYIIDNN